MILIAGFATEPPVRLAAAAAARLGVDHVVLDERTAHTWDVRLRVGARGVSARVCAGAVAVDLDTVTGAYLRLLGDEPPTPHLPDAMAAERGRAALALMWAWAQTTTARVANRPEPMASNTSKPYQAQLIRAAGFPTPPALVTDDPDAVRAFTQAQGRVVYKSTSGVRSVVRELTPDRMPDLARVRHLPTQFQRLVPGTNVRVHVAGDAVLACRIDSSTVDYRYGTDTAMEPVELPADVVTRCRALSRRLDLPLCGIDLIEDRHGDWWCLEVNSCPAYSCFEEPTGQPIADSLLSWLAQDDRVEEGVSWSA